MPLHRWLLRVVSRLVPRDVRAEWRDEWEAELDHREGTLREWTGESARKRDLLRRTSGAFWDALWLRSSRWYSLRLFGRHWRLALAAVLSLGLAIAAMTIGLSVYDVLLLRPPGVRDPNSLRMIHTRSSSEPYGAASFPEYSDYRDHTRSFSDVAAFQNGIAGVGFKDHERSEQVAAVEVSNNYFAVLGIQPAAGTLVFRASPTSDLADVAIGIRLWRRLGSDPGLIGRTITLGGQPVVIAGVVPATFRGMLWGFNPDVWMPFDTAAKVLGSDPAQRTGRTVRWLQMVGRLEASVSTEQAMAEVQAVAASIAREHPDSNDGRTAIVTALSVTPPGERQWTSMIAGALLFVVLLTLVVACTNVTNLLLGLSASRRREMLVRAALGASRLQLVVPLLEESATLGLLSGLFGYGLSWVALTRLASTTIPLGGFFPPVTIDLRPDGSVLIATMAIALVAGVAVGVAPALRGAADGLSSALNSERAGGAPRRTQIRSALVIVQMAVATVVLVGVGVSIRSLVSLERTPLGFSARHLVYVGIDMRRSGHDKTTGPAFYERMRERLSGTAGIEAVTLVDEPPLAGYSTDRVLAAGEAPGPDGHGLETPYAVVDDRYFSTLGINLLRGRTFDSRERAGTTEAVVINSTLARRHWPNRDPIGQTLRIENGNRLVEVVGVVEDAKYGDITEDQLPFMYFALPQHYLDNVTVVARTTRDRLEVLEPLLDMSAVMGGIGVLTLDDMLRLSVVLPKAIVWTTIVFGLIAVALAAFGLYSTVFHAVSQRRIEIGIRTTLGATSADLFALVLRQSGLVAAVGAGIGLAAGLALLPLAAAIFYGIGPIEPLVLACVSAAMLWSVLLVTYAVIRPWTRLSPSVLLGR